MAISPVFASGNALILYKLLNKRRQVKIERPTQPEYNDPGLQSLLICGRRDRPGAACFPFVPVVQRPPDNLQAAPFSSVPAPSLSQICTNAYLFRFIAFVNFLLMSF